MATILIVDDDATLRTWLADSLRREYRVLVASGGLEAITTLRRQPVDLVLLDIIMSEVDGFTVLAHAVGMARKPRVVVLSVHDAVDITVKAMKLGACDYLVKPCQLETVRRTIHKALSEEPMLVG